MNYPSQYNQQTDAVLGKRAQSVVSHQAYGNHTSSKKRSAARKVIRLFKKNKGIGILLILALLALLLISFKHIVLFLVVAVIAAIISYIGHNGLHLHLGHISFLAVIFSVTIGFQYGIMLIVIGHIIPEVLTGHFDPDLFISIAIYILGCLIALAFFGSVPIITLGITIATIQAIIGLILGFFLGSSPVDLATEHGLEWLLNLLYYGKIAVPLIAVLT